MYVVSGNWILLNPKTVKMEKDKGCRFLSSGLSRPFYRELKTPDEGSIEPRIPALQEQTKMSLSLSEFKVTATKQ